MDPLITAEQWRREGRQVALATVVRTWGSAPRPVGSAVVSEALDIIRTGKPTLVSFGVADEIAWRVGLSCGGKIEVFVARVD